MATTNTKVKTAATPLVLVPATSCSLHTGSPFCHVEPIPVAILIATTPADSCLFVMAPSHRHAYHALEAALSKLLLPILWQLPNRV